MIFYFKKKERGYSHNIKTNSQQCITQCMMPGSTHDPLSCCKRLQSLFLICHLQHTQLVFQAQTGSTPRLLLFLVGIPRHWGLWLHLGCTPLDLFSGCLVSPSLHDPFTLRNSTATEVAPSWPLPAPCLSCST